MLSPFLESVLEPQKGWISPRLVAHALRMQLQELSAIVQVHRNTLTRHPESPEVQNRLGQVVRIINRAAAMVGGDSNRAVLWFRYEPLSGFDRKTAEQLVAAGHGDAVEAHLDMLIEGVYA
ncbi:hypothetical protein [Gloeobacter kilaueensis]|uniref:Antitoxin Xre/MbcA/ParS-like toxin-binding domain-containing protein n=1 Tax=Gloeobacter kilaueensis (strain ATCC BAA-2537 / CCAP 1431/1 / ULC 316 / JS1) TaxID=1183438 RepID=U5QLE5_GLOK1|nr:hypothetical protein [Gloeobacter kilaueensis]AGY58414.1 hypothetical protein GKIL_2168 [Gloeobacter kilaueensis JS1]